MKPTDQLVDDIYREKIARARQMTISRRIEITCELSDLGRQMMRESIRAQFPGATEEDIRREMCRRIDLRRRLDDIPLPEPRISG